jgi:DNA-binding NarL/FixJ family response regulator
MSRPKTALIIDDEVHVRVYLRMLLKSLGVTTIHEAGTPDEAFTLYKAHKPEVVLLDIILPGATAQAVYKQLEEIDPDVAVIVVSAQNSLKIVEEMHEMGAIAYILKHTPRDQMVKMMGEALDCLDAD